mmetsp:Transcript_20244/g.32522  ORF Transcript_20244/g.32522 Transcript_20244/m.32522 type:complete len:118 (+) Transcript_20244:809-1162(+)
MTHKLSVLLLGYVRRNGWVFLAPYGKDCEIPKDALLVVVSRTQHDIDDLTDPNITDEQARKRRKGAVPISLTLRDEGLLRSYDRVKITIRQDSIDNHNTLTLGWWCIRTVRNTKNRN